MRIIEGEPRGLHYDKDGKAHAKLDLQVSTIEELPAIDEEVEGIGTDPGSIAQLIQTGDWVTLDADGDWYDGSGSVVS